jgi:hypothetical protein
MAPRFGKPWIMYLIACLWSFWVGARDLGVWFTLSNEESARTINHLWFFLGPFAFFPLLLFSLFFRKTFGTILLVCGVVFSLISIIGRPFNLSLFETMMQVLQIGVPMVVLGCFQFLRGGAAAQRVEENLA